MVYASAVVLALSGFAKEAQPLLDQTLKEYHPTDTLAKAVYVPTICAALDLTNGNAPAAIDELQAAAAYDARNFRVMYLRASAYLAANRPSDAAVEFQKMIDRSHNNLNFNTPIARLGLGRALAQSGDTAKSRTAYQDFFAAWKDADPDIPILIAAKKEYAQLK